MDPHDSTSFGYPAGAHASGEATAAVYVTAQAASGFVERLLVCHDVPGGDATLIADCLVSADLRGVSTHGIVRLPGYLDRLRRGLIAARPDVTVRRLTPASAKVDGGNGFGFVIACRAVDVAVELARDVGVGVVSVSRSTHFGAAATYALRGLRAGVVTIVMTNSAPAMPPFGGSRPLLGTGPLAVGAPGGTRSHDFVLDMSPAVAARGKIRLAAQRGEQIPAGYALTAGGVPTTDPWQALNGVLLPMGGPKGSGLALTIDILCGVLTGAAFAGDVGDQYTDYDQPQNVGHFVLAMRPDLFVSMEEYGQRMDTLADRVHGNPPVAGTDAVLMPGEVELRNQKQRGATGIVVGPKELAALQDEAHRCGVAPLEYSDSPADGSPAS